MLGGPRTRSRPPSGACCGLANTLQVGDRSFPRGTRTTRASRHPNRLRRASVSGLSRPGSYAQYQEVPKDETGLPLSRSRSYRWPRLRLFVPQRWSAKRPGDHVLVTAGSSEPGRSPCRSRRHSAPRCGDRRVARDRRGPASTRLRSVTQIQSLRQGRRRRVEPQFSQILDATHLRELSCRSGRVHGRHRAPSTFAGQKQIRVRRRRSNLRWALD